MVKAVVRSVKPNIPIIEVVASRGKVTRAEPISALYEQGKVSHVGSFSKLEDQMVVFTPFGIVGRTTGDRVDAMVHAMTALFPGIISFKSKSDKIPKAPEDRWRKAFKKRDGDVDSNSWKVS
jgi:phage terminase large subunit-like protein